MSLTPAARRWSAILDDYESSGLTRRAFAEAQGLHPSTLASWRSKLGRSSARRAKEVGSTELVVGEGEPAPDDQGAPAASAALRIRLVGARDPVDFRKSIDGLAAVCEVHLQDKPLDGTLYVFVHRRRTGLKRRRPASQRFVLDERQAQLLADPEVPPPPRSPVPEPQSDEDPQNDENWLFARSEGGAKDTDRLMDYPGHRVAELTPKNGRLARCTHTPGTG